MEVEADKLLDLYSDWHNFDFHYQIALASGNQRLIDLLCGDIWCIMRLYRYPGILNRGRVPLGQADHEAILQALEAHDPDACERLMRQHLAHAQEALLHDWSLMLRAARKANIPVIVGSAGTAGGDVHVDWVLEIVREIVAEHKLKLRTAVIYAEQDKTYLKNLLKQSRIIPLNPAPPISDHVIDRSIRIVGMMGVEPLQQAIGDGADFVLAGRSSDSALFAAIPVMRGFPPGLAWHAGKVSECGTLVCETLGKGVISTTVSYDEITIRPYGDGLRCTPQSVAAHGLYENADPFLHRECSGPLDLRNATFEAIDDVTVRIRGTEYFSEPVYTVKLEGAELAGYQSIIVGGIRDPYVIRQLDSWLGSVRNYIDDVVARVLGDKPEKR